MTVAIISNSPHQPDNRSRIDSCDEVVRFSICTGLNHNTGSKTTQWVTRTRYRFTDRLEREHGHLMRQGVGDSHVAYINYGSNNQGCVGVLGYDPEVVHRLCPENHTIECVPCNMRGIVLLHPTRHPTNGFMFLISVLQRQLFQDHEILLFGFDNFKDEYIHHSHSNDWEFTHIEDWINKGYFTRA